MACRAGCRVANMEFNQFHPTCLYHPLAKSFLISEALRGKAPFYDSNGEEAFMSRFDERAELASRDIVARAIDFEMKRLVAITCCWTSVTGPLKTSSVVSRRSISVVFPSVLTSQQRPSRSFLRHTTPVAASWTDLAGRTDVNGLYAVGESTYTGLRWRQSNGEQFLLSAWSLLARLPEEIASSARPGTTFLIFPPGMQAKSRPQRKMC